MTTPRSSSPPSGHSPREFELYDELMPVRRYKLLLQALLKRRGSGSRQAIAAALGNTRSFITQITSPAYDLAIPAQHVRTIIDHAQMTPYEERMFLDAYIEAHPERETEVLGRAGDGKHSRTLMLRVPLLASIAAQQRLEGMIERFAKDLATTMLETQAEFGVADSRTDDAA